MNIRRVTPSPRSPQQAELTRDQMAVKGLEGSLANDSNVILDFYTPPRLARTTRDATG